MLASGSGHAGDGAAATCPPGSRSTGSTHTKGVVSLKSRCEVLTPAPQDMAVAGAGTSNGNFQWSLGGALTQRDRSVPLKGDQGTVTEDMGEGAPTRHGEASGQPGLRARVQDGGEATGAPEAARAVVAFATVAPGHHSNGLTLIPESFGPNWQKPGSQTPWPSSLSQWDTAGRTVPKGNDGRDASPPANGGSRVVPLKSPPAQGGGRDMGPSSLTAKIVP